MSRGAPPSAGAVAWPGGPREPRAQRRAETLAALIEGARPRQWIKNVLVLLAPAAGGVLGRDDVPGRVTAAALAFCLVCSGTYLLNDVRDRHRDRRHPVKRRRPVASGALAPATAVVAALAAIACGLLVAAAVSAALVAAVVGYLTLTGLYTMALKRLPLVEMLAVAGCYVVRAAAGGAAAGVAISGWFLAVVSFAALLLVAGKRHAEHRAGASLGFPSRQVLGFYRAGALQALGAACAIATALGYWLWALSHPGTASGVPFSQLSTLPVVGGLGRYVVLLRAGRAEAPEELAFGDRPLQALALAWVLLFGIGLYVGS